MVKAKHGIVNEYDQEKKIYGNLEDDQAKINKVFEIFNQEFFGDSLDKPVIFISPEAKVLYKVECPGEWKKEKDGKVDDELMQIILSKRIYEYDTKEFYVLFLEAMIKQYDLEQDKIYEAAKQNRKKLINNNGHYKSKEYYKYCEQLGLHVQTIPATEAEKERKIVTAGDGFNKVYEDRNIEEIGKLVYSFMKKDEKKKIRQSMRALQCPNCKLIIRVTKQDNVDIRCYNHSKEGIPCNGTRFIEGLKETKV
ncbi:MAG: hypothetical protein E7266_09650 [Lachnospiraceae bacterium]|nr:hypothetical protein [Lachnospiraceae bacterium]